MALLDKYNSKTEEEKKPDPKKTTISDESFAILEALEELKGMIQLKL